MTTLQKLTLIIKIELSLSLRLSVSNRVNEQKEIVHSLCSLTLCPWALMESNHPPTDYESVALTE